MATNEFTNISFPISLACSFAIHLAISLASALPLLLLLPPPPPPPLPPYPLALFTTRIKTCLDNATVVYCTLYIMCIVYSTVQSVGVLPQDVPYTYRTLSNYGLSCRPPHRCCRYTAAILPLYILPLLRLLDVVADAIALPLVSS